MRLSAASLLLALLVSAPAVAQPMTVEVAFPRLELDSPLDIQHAPGVADRLYVVTKPGRIFTFASTHDTSSASLFLDIGDRTVITGECGLLGLAFDPDFTQTGYFYCYYASPERSIISRFSVDPSNRDSALASSEKIILDIPQTGAGNHKGGQIAFGPDGNLYIALGDGGGGGDTFNTGQDLTSLLAKILRIDVRDTSAGRAYAIPSGNPFAGATDGRREETFAYGFRNPWRFSFDRATGQLWAGDVGQDLYEEIDLVDVGENFGWPIMEGRACFRPATECDSTGLAMPIWVYPHSGPDSMSGVSVIGGHVYRGSRFPELVGKYIYGDIGSGNIWALDYQPEGETTNRLIASTDLPITSFGVDAQGELYLTVFGGPGRIYRLAAIPSRVPGERAMAPATIAASSVSPIPASGTVTIEYTLGRASDIRLTIADALGRELLTLVDGLRTGGTYREQLAAGTLAPGAYYYTIAAGEERRTGRFVVR